MSMKEAYKQKAEAELDLAHARLTEFKAKAKKFTADTHIKYAKHIEELEHGVETSKARLKELSEAGEDNWDKFKDAFERTLSALRKTMHDTAEKFKD
jgi:hypothetical protein